MTGDRAAPSRGRTQDRSASGAPRDILRQLRGTGLGGALETTLAAAKRNPIPLMLLAAGAGWLIHRIVDERSHRPSLRRRMRRAERIPVLNTGQTRVYDPDASSRHPTLDALESRREMSARI